MLEDSEERWFNCSFDIDRYLYEHPRAVMVGTMVSGGLIFLYGLFLPDRDYRIFVVGGIVAAKGFFDFYMQCGLRSQPA